MNRRVPAWMFWRDPWWWGWLTGGLATMTAFVWVDVGDWWSFAILVAVAVVGAAVMELVLWLTRGDET